MSAVASDITEDDTPSNPNHSDSETVKDPLRNNVSPVVTDVISNAINVITLLEAFSGMIPAPPFVATIFTLVKVIVKLVQKVRLNKGRGLRLIRRVEQFGHDVCAAVESEPEHMDWPMANNIARLLKSLVDVYQTLEKYLTKKFAYRLIRNGKISSVIDNATEALNTAWDIFQFSARLSLAVNVSRYGQNVHKLSIYDERNFRLFHPGDILCQRKRGMWLDGETSMGEEWEGVFLEKIPCDVWQDLRHERPVIVRKFEKKPDKVTYDPGRYVHALPEVVWEPGRPQVLGYSHPLYDGEKYYVVELLGEPICTESSPRLLA